MSTLLVLATLAAAIAAVFLIHRDGYEIGREHGRNEIERKDRQCL